MPIDIGYLTPEELIREQYRGIRYQIGRLLSP